MSAEYITAEEMARDAKVDPKRFRKALRKDTSCKKWHARYDRWTVIRDDEQAQRDDARFETAFKLRHRPSRSPLCIRSKNVLRIRPSLQRQISDLAEHVSPVQKRPFVGWIYCLILEYKN